MPARDLMRLPRICGHSGGDARGVDPHPSRSSATQELLGKLASYWRMRLTCAVTRLFCLDERCDLACILAGGVDPSRFAFPGPRASDTLQDLGAMIAEFTSTSPRLLNWVPHAALGMLRSSQSSCFQKR